MKLDRAYSVLEIKAVDDDERVIEGIATTPAADRIGDVVEPKGAEFKLPLPLLWQHDARQPIGHVTWAKATKEGIPFRAKLVKVDEPGKLKDRLDEAWQSIKSGLVRAVSIGFRSIEHSIMEDGGWRFIRWEWMELSAVTIPANAEATITTIRSIDAEQRAASGRELSAPDRRAPPGAPGPKQPQTRKVTTMKTIAEQIAAFEASRAAKQARIDELMAKAAETGQTLDDAESEEYDLLEKDVEKIDLHLTRLRAQEAKQAKQATPVVGKDIRSATESRGGAIAVMGHNLPKGTAFTRYTMALARSKGNLMQAAEIAKQWHETTPEVEAVLKAAVAAGTTTDSTWAAPLVEYQVMASEFIDLLRPATVIGRIPGLRRVPFNIQMPRQTSGSSVNWVGEGKAKPLTRLAFDTVTLRWAKAAGIVVLTQELVRFSNPAAEGVVRQDLIDAMAAFLDVQFLDPAVAESPNVSPASITNGVDPIPATGTTAAHLRADVKSLFNAYIAANLSVAGAVWIMTEQMALSISMMQNALGQPEFPGITPTGGVFFGLPVITSQSTPNNLVDDASPPQYAAGQMIILAKPSEIMLADDGGVAIDVSAEASLQMDSSPTEPTDASTVLVSLWQRNMMAVRAERWINWKRRRPDAVQWIAGAAYTA